MPGVEPAHHRAALAAAAMLATLPVAARSRAPVVAIALTTAGVTLAEIVAGSQDALAPFAALLLEAFALGARARPRAGVLTFLAVVAVLGGGDPPNVIFV